MKILIVSLLFVLALCPVRVRGRVPDAVVAMSRDMIPSSDTSDVFASADPTAALAAYWGDRNPLLHTYYFGHHAGYRGYTASDCFFDGLRNIPELFKIGVVPFPGEDLAAAEEIARKIVAAAPDDPVAHCALGYVLLENGLYEGAEASFNAALKLDRRLVEARNGQGLSLLARGNVGTTGLEVLRETLAIDKDYAEAYYGLAMGQIVLKTRDIGTHFEDLVEKFPDHRDGWFKLGAFHEAEFLVEMYADYNKAADAFKRQTEVAPEHPRAWFRLGSALNVAGRPDEAIAALDRVTSDHLDARHGYLPYCFAACLTKRDGAGAGRSAEEYMRGLDAETRVRFEDVRLIATPGEASSFFLLTEYERPAFLDAFWQKRDPTPFTSENERRIEHYRRVHHAIQHYPTEDGGWDRRGDVYIRYGRPAHISRWNSIRNERSGVPWYLKDKVLMSLPLSARHEIAEAIKHLAYDASLGRYLPASERRVYREGAGREELMDAVVGFPLYPLGDAQRWEYWLYHNVEDGLEIVFASSELQGPMGYPESPDRGRGNDLFWQAYHPGRHLDYLADVQPDVYERPNPISVTLDYADFRGVGARSRLEMYFGFSHLNLAPIRADTGRVVRGIALFDDVWKRRYRRTDTLTFVKREDREEIGISEFAVNLPAGKYAVGLQFEDVASGSEGSAYLEIEIESYATGQLGLSDVQLATAIREYDQNGRKGLAVIANPSRRFYGEGPAKFYYQVYGLVTDDKGRARLRVRYHVDALAGGDTFSGRVTRGAGKFHGKGIGKGSSVEAEFEPSGPNQEAYIEIDTSGSDEGRYVMTVTVTDRVSNEERTKTAEFEIVK